MRTPLNSVIIVTALVALREYVHSAPIISTASQTRPAIGYLLQYGYLEKKNFSDSAGSTHIDVTEVKRAIQDLQRFGNLAVTGELNRETLELLGKKRCGLKDPVKKLNTVTSNPIGQFYLQGTYWKKKHLTYRFKEPTSDLSSEEQRNICRKMFGLWDRASSLTITEETDSSVKDDDVDILIRFVNGYHDDPYSFDGEGGTLAHAFYPHNNKGLSGDAHFDDDEHFTTQTTDGINLDWVAVHEFGHSLGLQHSNVRESIMYPWYKGYVPDIKLTRDDIKGIQALYGAEKPLSKSTTPSTPSTEPSTEPAPCPILTPTCQTGSRYDAVVVEDPYNSKMKRLTHFIRGDKVWSLDDKLRKSGPVKVTCYWPHITTPINAAYRNKQKNIVFFSGYRVLEYSRTRELVRSINLEQYGLHSNLTDMDAVFTWRNGRTYFFKGSQYWRYNEEEHKLDKGYPRPIQAGWPDLPNDIDAAVTWPRNDKSYVFKDDYYLRLHTHASGRQVRVEQRYLDRGKKTHKEWMRCHGNVVGAIIGSLIADP